MQDNKSLMGVFTHHKSLKTRWYDVHHLMEKSTAKRYDLNPYFYFNQVVLEHDFHINKITRNKSKNGIKAQEELYRHIMELVYMRSFMDKLTYNQQMSVVAYYHWCTIEMNDKKYYWEYNELIMEGYEILKKESENEKEVYTGYNQN